MGNKKSRSRWAALKQEVAENKSAIIISAVTTIVVRLLLGL